jgi:hypothetical protein
MVAEEPFAGWSSIHLANGLIDLTIVPDLGGRIMACSLGPHQFIFMNHALDGQLFSVAESEGDGSLAAWKNYGGDKTWPAPEAQRSRTGWHGPPDGTLDTGKYSAVTMQDANAVGVALTSAADARTGLEIQRRLTLFENSARLRLDLQFTNVVDRAIQWSIWDVLQLNCGQRATDGSIGVNDNCWLYVPYCRDGTPPKIWPLSGDFGAQFHEHIVDGISGVQYLGALGKIGAFADSGWLAFTDTAAGFVLCLRFPHDAEATYPDGGATVECFTESPLATSTPEFGSYQSVGFVLEAEVLGPLVTLDPGEVSALTIEWSATRCPSPVRHVSEAGCVHAPLVAKERGRYVLLSGIFGTFDEGQLLCTWLSHAGVPLHQVPLQHVSPLSTLHLDQVLELPGGAGQVTLEVQRPDGSLAGSLGTARIA